MHILNQLNSAQETTREEYQRQSEGDKEAKKGGTKQHKTGRERGTKENQKSAKRTLKSPFKAGKTVSLLLKFSCKSSSTLFSLKVRRLS